MAQTLGPISDVSVDAAWSLVNNGGPETQHWEVQDDFVQASTDDATYSSCSSNAKILELEIDDVDDPGDSGLHLLRWRHRRRGSGAVSPITRMKVMQGTTTIATITRAPSTGFTLETYILTSGEAANITDYDDLRVQEDRSSGSATVAIDVSEAWMIFGDAPVPVADFTQDVTSGYASLTVNFTDTSDDGGTPADSDMTDWTYLWVFTAVSGGPAPSNSTTQDPSISFTNAGVYTVALTVTGPGGNDTETKASHITVHKGVDPGTASNLALAGPAVTLDVPVEMSPGTAADLALAAPVVTLDVPVELDPGTAAALTLAAPAVTLDVPVELDPGTAAALTLAAPAVTLDVPVELDPGTAPDLSLVAQSVTLGLGLDADFSGTPLSGCAPLSVAFTDASSGATTRTWHFGDGNTSTDTNPTHEYVDPMLYNVKLVVKSGRLSNFTDTELKYAYVHALDCDQLPGPVVVQTTGARLDAAQVEGEWPS